MSHAVSGENPGPPLVRERKLSEYSLARSSLKEKEGTYITLPGNQY